MLSVSRVSHVVVDWILVYHPMNTKAGFTVKLITTWWSGDVWFVLHGKLPWLIQHPYWTGTKNTLVNNQLVLMYVPHLLLVNTIIPNIFDVFIATSQSILKWLVSLNVKESCFVVQTSTSCTCPNVEDVVVQWKRKLFLQQMANWRENGISIASVVM